MRPKKVILCVGDNEQELSVRKFMLETRGYRVISANSGAEAVQAFSRNTVDLVVAGYSLPDTNGGELIGRLKRITPGVPMILLGDPQKIDAKDADIILAKKDSSPLDLLYRVRIMTARSRVGGKFLTPSEAAEMLGTPKRRLAELLRIAKESVA